MQPGAPSLESDVNGCPSHTSPNVFRFRYDRLFFREDSSALDPESAPVLARLIADLQRCSVITLTLAPHASRSEERRNHRLSQQRAEAIRAALVAAGVAASRVIVQPRRYRSSEAFGPVSHDMVNHPRWQRRVEVVINNAVDGRRCYGPQP